MNYTYLLRCADDTLYCGWTSDLGRRVQSHQAGTGGKYTRSRRPVQLIYAEQWPTRKEAMSREWQIKHLTREEKWALIDRAADPSGE